MLTRVQFDPKFGGDKSVIDGVAGHWQDPLEVKSTLSGKPFGLGLESASAYVSPLTAEIGKEGVDQLEDGKLGSATDSRGQEEVMLDFSIPQKPQILDLRAATKFLEGSCKRRWGQVANRFGQLSQEKLPRPFLVGTVVDVDRSVCSWSRSCVPRDEIRTERRRRRRRLGADYGTNCWGRSPHGRASPG